MPQAAANGDQGSAAGDFSVSVVLPTYNRAGLLPATLDAILAQSLRPREIIVVDDGSKDDTMAVLAGYAPSVQAIRIDNSGDLVARNIGLRAASSEFVAFCDSDDLWRPDFLRGMLALWQAEPAAKFAFSDFVILRDDVWENDAKFATATPGFWDGLRRAGPDLAVFDQPILDRLLDFQPFFPSCLVARRNFFLQIGGWDEGASRLVGCDFATALRLGEYTPFGVVQRPLVGIRKHGSNISGDAMAMALGDSKVLEHVLATRPWLAPQAASIRANIGHRRRIALELAFDRRDFAQVRAIYPMLPPEQRWPRIRAKHLIAVATRLAPGRARAG
jgi:glycosyltransferase involved in cell wall biosynthesis